LFKIIFTVIFFEVLDYDFKVPHLFQQLLVMASALQRVPAADEGRHAVEDSELSDLGSIYLRLFLELMIARFFSRKLT
jgi:hypothetical protein